MLTHPGFAATILVPTDAAFEALGARADDRAFMKEARCGAARGGFGRKAFALGNFQINRSLTSAPFAPPSRRR